MNNINGHKEVISEIKKLRNVLLEAEVDKSTHVNANGVRTHLNSLGYAHKSTLDEVGDITPELANIIKKLSSAFKKEMPELKIRFGSGRDKTHQNYSKSRHNKGNANDIVFWKNKEKDIKVTDDEILDKISTLMCAARNSINGFSFIDEYRYPTPNSSGPHYHISYSQNNKDEVPSTPKFCNSIPNSNLGSFEFPEPVPAWVDMSQSDIDTQINKVMASIGVGEIADIVSKSDCKSFIKKIEGLLGKDVLEYKENPCDILWFGYPVSEYVEISKEVTKEYDAKLKKLQDEEKKKEEESKKKEEEKESSLTEELKNFKRFIK
jgi:hypothetical protein